MSIYINTIKKVLEGCSNYRNGKIGLDYLQGILCSAEDHIVLLEEKDLRDFLAEVEGTLEILRFTCDKDKTFAKSLPIVQEVEERLRKELPSETNEKKYMNPENWKVDPENLPVIDGDINFIEDAIGHKFPKLFIDIVKQFNGGSYNFCEFDIDEPQMTLYLDHLIPLSAIPFYTELPSGLIAFGACQGHDLLCFDYRIGKDPSIVYWSHEKQQALFVADSFTDFMNMLYLTDLS